MDKKTRVIIMPFPQAFGLNLLVKCGTLFAILVLAGCSPSEDRRQENESNPGLSQGTHKDVSEKNCLPELWYVNYVLGERVGYERQCFTWVEENGRRLRKTSGESRLRVKRSNTTVEMVVRHTCWELPDGRPIRFEVEVDQGGSFNRSEGRIDNGQLVLAIQVAGRAMQQTLPCPSDCRGFLGLQESLFEDPMKPGEHRQLTTLVPGLSDFATLTLEAGEHEVIKVGRDSTECLPIQFTMTLRSGNTMRGRLWLDRRGIITKQETDFPQMTAILASRDEALEEPPDPTLDLVRDIRVPVKPPLSDPERATQVVYRVSSKTEDLASLLRSDHHQTVKPLGDYTVELCVHPPQFPPNKAIAGEIADASTTRPSLWIQSDASEIVALSEAAAGGASGWEQLPALSRFVYRKIKNKGYDQAFLSALEVAQRKEGDCTEHAVLLAALARARGFPARVAVGLVFRQDAFYYHMWTEILVNNCWVGFDATRERGVVTPGYIKLGHDSLGHSDGMAVFLPAIKLLGQIEIEFVSIE
ncbi:MAG: transglutaminase-like domain-containing protein [Thermogutta sp.]